MKVIKAICVALILPLLIVGSAFLGYVVYEDYREDVLRDNISQQVSTLSEAEWDAAWEPLMEYLENERKLHHRPHGDRTLEDE